MSTNNRVIVAIRDIVVLFNMDGRVYEVEAQKFAETLSCWFDETLFSGGKKTFKTTAFERRVLTRLAGI